MSRLVLLLFLLAVFGVLVTDLVLVIRSAVGKIPIPDDNRALGWWGDVQILIASSVNAINAVSQPVGSFIEIRYWTQLAVATSVFFGWPALVAYLVYGRKKHRNYRKFARLFLWLSVFHPIIIFRSAAAISSAILLPAMKRRCKNVWE